MRAPVEIKRVSDIKLLVNKISQFIEPGEGRSHWIPEEKEDGLIRYYLNEDATKRSLSQQF